MADMYVGINGKARKIIKAYVGVNGVARAITAGYAGVGGVARNVFSSTTVAMPQKGDTITLNSADDGNFDQYAFKVLSTSGSVAKLLFLNTDKDGIFTTPFTQTKWYDTSDGSSDSTDYSISLVYTALNETFYQNFLPSDIQSGITAANPDGTSVETWQYSWQLSTGMEANSYPANLDTGIYFCVESGIQGQHYPDPPIYPLSLYDIIEYLGTTTSMTINNTTLTSQNLVKMLLPSRASSSYIPMDGSGYWLMDANQDVTEMITLTPTGNLEECSIQEEKYICPVVHIDLTDISWQTV